MKLGVQMNGAGEIVQVLREVGKIADPPRLRRALVTSGRVVAEEMARIVRKKSRVLEGDMGVVEIKDDASGATAAVAVGPKTQALYHRARLLQDGYLRKNKRTGAVSHIPGYQFAQPAYDAKGEAAAAVFEAEITRGVGGLS